MLAMAERLVDGALGALTLYAMEKETHSSYLASSRQALISFLALRLGKSLAFRLLGRFLVSRAPTFRRFRENGRNERHEWRPNGFPLYSAADS